MITGSIERLQYLCNTIPALLLAIPDADINHQPAGKWSKKQIIGHLIDSAANNHQRFVRTQFEDIPAIRYDQNNWNCYSYYDRMKASHVIGFWESYNRHLLEVIRHIPKEFLERTCNTGGEPVTLHWLIDDYVNHMEHHLRQVINY